MKIYPVGKMGARTARRFALDPTMFNLSRVSHVTFNAASILRTSNVNLELNGLRLIKPKILGALIGPESSLSVSVPKSTP